MQVGTTKDQGLYSKPSAALHPVGISRRDPTTIKYNRHPTVFSYKGRGKDLPRTGYEGSEGKYMYKSTFNFCARWGR